jgi:hypothetical protein
MKESEHVAVCQRTDRKEERVRLRNRRTGATALTNFCTTEGGTIQVQLDDGTLDSWLAEECEEVPET